MKKLFLLIVAIYVGISLMGCAREPNTRIPIEKPNIENDKIENKEEVEKTDWKPTAYETVNNFEGVSMIVKKGTESSTKLTVILENNSRSQCIYGEFFCLEKKINGRWYQVPIPTDGNYGINSIGYSLASGDIGEKIIDWNWIYGSLGQGEYRIVKDISDFRGTGDYDNYYLDAKFIIY